MIRAFPATADDYRERVRRRLLASAGAAGLGALLASWRQELHIAMALTGATCIDAIDASRVDAG